MGKTQIRLKWKKTKIATVKKFPCSSITLKLLILVVPAKYLSGCLDHVDFTRVLPLLFRCPVALTLGAPEKNLHFFVLCIIFMKVLEQIETLL